MKNIRFLILIVLVLFYGCDSVDFNNLSNYLKEPNNCFIFAKCSIRDTAISSSQTDLSYLNRSYYEVNESIRISVTLEFEEVNSKKHYTLFFWDSYGPKNYDIIKVPEGRYRLQNFILHYTYERSFENRDFGFLLNDPIDEYLNINIEFDIRKNQIFYVGDFSGILKYCFILVEYPNHNELEYTFSFPYLNYNNNYDDGIEYLLQKTNNKQFSYEIYYYK